MLVFDGNGVIGQQNLWEAGNGGGGVCGEAPLFEEWHQVIFGDEAHRVDELVCLVGVRFVIDLDIGLFAEILMHFLDRIPTVHAF